MQPFAEAVREWEIAESPLLWLRAFVWPWWQRPYLHITAIILCPYAVMVALHAVPGLPWFIGLATLADSVPFGAAPGRVLTVQIASFIFTYDWWTLPALALLTYAPKGLFYTFLARRRVALAVGAQVMQGLMWVAFIANPFWLMIAGVPLALHTIIFKPRRLAWRSAAMARPITIDLPTIGRGERRGTDPPAERE